MKGLDTYMDERFSEANEDGPPCAECLHACELHVDGRCVKCDELYKPEYQCEGHEPADPRDFAPDDWEDE